MVSKALMLFLRLARRLGVRVVLMTVLALIAVFVAPALDPLIPDSFKDRFDRDAVLPILNILASTMLAATTFSLGVMVQAFQSAAGQATPRAYRILMQDGTTQTVLATFVSTFLFSLTAIVMFRAEFYGDAAAVVIFALTVLSIALVIIAILRWIDHLSQLGSMDHTLRMVENAARDCLKTVAEAPCLGANDLARHDGPPPDSVAILANRSGYVQFVNMPALHDALERCDARLWITAPPGSYALTGGVLGYLSGADTRLVEEAADHFTLERERTLEQDARFGMIVLSEIAARALSPGVNDPGTAIDVIQRLKNLLWNHAHEDRPQTRDILYPRAYAPRVTAAALVQDGFDVIIRDGAGRPEVIGTIIKALNDLAGSDWPPLAEAARDTLDYAREHAEAALTLQADREAVRELIRR